MTYGGPALIGTMDVRELAPALLMAGKLIENANLQMNGEASKVHVLVKSDFRTGSFEISLEIIQSLIETAKALLDIGKHYDAQEVLAILGLAASSSMGLIRFLKWLRGREIESTTTLNDGRVSVVAKGDSNSVTVNNFVVQLAEDRLIRQAVDGIVKPLDQEGIDRLTFTSDGKEVESIDKQERLFFSVPPSEEPDVTDNIGEYLYEIVSPAFETRFKWRLKDNRGTIWAAVKDARFLEEIEQGMQTFGKGDTIKAMMHIHQSAGPNGIDTEYEVLEVLEHTRAFRPLRLPLSEHGDSDETPNP